LFQNEESEELVSSSSQEIRFVNAGVQASLSASGSSKEGKGGKHSKAAAAAAAAAAAGSTIHMQENELKQIVEKVIIFFKVLTILYNTRTE
jgi:glutamate 5-kinase